MINFAATITAAGTVTFYGDASNTGTITAAETVTFYGSANNTGTINGNVEFNDTSRNGNNGTINGDAVFEGVDTENFGTVTGVQTYNPPLLAQWIKLKWSSDEPWIARQIGTYRVYGREIHQNYPYQACPYPNDGCYKLPHLYREEFPNLPPYVMDYANHPEYNNGKIASTPPFKAAWVTSGRNRRLVLIPSRNVEQFQALNLPFEPLYGPWQPCPDGESCFAYPALYRPLESFDFVMDYENNPNYLEHPGNPE